MPSKKIQYYLSCLTNVNFNNMDKVLKKATLFNHWLVNFDDMHDIVKKQVVKDIFEELKEAGIEDITLVDLLKELGCYPDGCCDKCILIDCNPTFCECDCHKKGDE